MKPVTVATKVIGYGIAAIGFLLLALPAVARDMQDVLNEGRLRVGVGLFAPWAVRSSEGDVLGFEVDVAQRLAADMGVRADIRVYDFERLIPALEAGEIDIIAAAFMITPERALHVNFSQPYAEGGIALAANQSNTAAVLELTDLDDAARTVAAVEGSTAIELVRRALPRAKLRVFPSIEAASAALVAGEVDAYLEDEPVPTFLALEHPDVIDVPLARPLLPSPQGFAVRKGDHDFLAFLNAWIVARTADTWLPTTTSYWFGSLNWRGRVENATNR